MTNLLGVFFSSFPTTASFSATALKARCLVPTPLSGLFTSALIILSLYALTGAFYYVPTAGLAAVIISSATGLVDGSEGIHYWHISRIEAVIWISSVIATVFAGVQYGISIAILASLALLLIRIAKPRGQFLGTTTLRLVDEKGNEFTREVFIPLDLGDEGVLNVKTVVKPPAPWIVIYRLGESFTYPNALSVNMSIMEYFKGNAKRSPQSAESGKRERLWNETNSLGSVSENEREKRRRPIRAVIFDLTSVCV
jgi:sodium-independent sulfate anion transporter 11